MTVRIIMIIDALLTNSPGESRLFFKRLDHFDDVCGVSRAPAFRHPSATSPPQRLALAGCGATLSF